MYIFDLCIDYIEALPFHNDPDDCTSNTLQMSVVIQVFKNEVRNNCLIDKSFSNSVNRYAHGV